MKILQINSVCGYGSTGRIVVDLYDKLIENGHECIVAYGRGKSPKRIRNIKIGNNFDLFWHIFITRMFDKHGSGSIRATKKLIKQIDEYNPDVIHLHNIHGYYINIKILFEYLKKLNKPIIWTLHDCWSFTGHCAYFDYINCEKWKVSCEKCLQKGAYPASFMDNSKNNYNMKKELLKDLKKMTLVTPSKWLANLLKESFLKDNNIETIHNGIDLSVFKPLQSDIRKKYKLENKKIILGVASKWEKRKGLDTFIKLSNDLNDSYKIILIGISKKDKKKLPENIIAISRTNNVKELVEFYSMADIFINPTLEDNFPTTNLEALACGTPVITYKTGGSIEPINEECGIIVEKGNIKQLIDVIKNFNKNKYSGCIEQSKKYDKNEKYEEYIQLYEKVK